MESILIIELEDPNEFDFLKGLIEEAMESRLNSQASISSWKKNVDYSWKAMVCPLCGSDV